MNEILASEGGMAINQPIITYLLSRIREFNEWGQCAVLELTAKYTPANNEEMFDIMVSHICVVVFSGPFGLWWGYCFVAAAVLAVYMQR